MSTLTFKTSRSRMARERLTRTGSIRWFHGKEELRGKASSCSDIRRVVPRGTTICTASADCSITSGDEITCMPVWLLDSDTRQQFTPNLVPCWLQPVSIRDCLQLRSLAVLQSASMPASTQGPAATVTTSSRCSIACVCRRTEPSFSRHAAGLASRSAVWGLKAQTTEVWSLDPESSRQPHAARQWTPLWLSSPGRISVPGCCAVPRSSPPKLHK
mmetsp:Transcript_4722/g.13936  ORF Transcript_4722/g.13936 Transcript_4722/m.13936 type:complete len:215 (+) Transcript_4722:1243-1887(+)